MSRTSPNRYGKIDDPIAPYMSPDEVAYLIREYEKAEVILEYGSGGSTRIASKMLGKHVFSVESDLEWAKALQAEIDASNPVSPVTVYHSDIGEVGAWGRPLHEADWRKYQRYPLAIWDQPNFLHPDLILIDGRMRSACLMYAMMRIEKPVTVLFDDYGARTLYSQVERIIKPVRIINTMAHFELVPDSIPKKDLGFAISRFFLGSFHGQGDEFYEADNIL